MAGQRIPLPKHEDLPEGVYFHHRLIGDSTQLILQMPTNEDFTDSETYLIDREDSAHQGWLEALNNSRQLIDLLIYAPHVAYCVSTGYVEELPDLDEPNLNQMRISHARQEASRGAQMQSRFGSGCLRQVPPPSMFRRALMGRGQR